MNTMRCLIVDDEAPARRELKQILSVYPEIEVVGEAGDIDSSLRLADKLRPDVIFLDIRLRSEEGFDFIHRSTIPLPHVVFVTAHDEYAVRAFECHALDYLLKPVHPDRLAATLERMTAYNQSPGTGLRVPSANEGGRTRPARETGPEPTRSRCALLDRPRQDQSGDRGIVE
jgi:two-component system LytT family response regulator